MDYSKQQAPLNLAMQDEPDNIEVNYEPQMRNTVTDNAEAYFSFRNNEEAKAQEEPPRSEESGVAEEPE